MGHINRTNLALAVLATAPGLNHPTFSELHEAAAKTILETLRPEKESLVKRAEELMAETATFEGEAVLETWHEGVQADGRPFTSRCITVKYPSQKDAYLVVAMDERALALSGGSIVNYSVTPANKDAAPVQPKTVSADCCTTKAAGPPDCESEPSEAPPTIYHAHVRFLEASGERSSFSKGGLNYYLDAAGFVTNRVCDAIGRGAKVMAVEISNSGF